MLGVEVPVNVVLVVGEIDDVGEAVGDLLAV